MTVLSLTYRRRAIVVVSTPSTANCRISVSRLESPEISLVSWRAVWCIADSGLVVVAEDARRVESPRLAASMTPTALASDTCRPITAIAPAARSGDAASSSWQSSMSTILVLGSAETRDRVRCRPRRGSPHEQITMRSQPRCDRTTFSKVESGEHTTSIPCAINADEISSAMSSCAATTQTRHCCATGESSG